MNGLISVASLVWAAVYAGVFIWGIRLLRYTIKDRAWVGCGLVIFGLCLCAITIIVALAEFIASVLNAL